MFWFWVWRNASWCQRSDLYIKTYSGPISQANKHKTQWSLAAMLPVTRCVKIVCNVEAVHLHQTIWWVLLYHACMYTLHSCNTGKKKTGGNLETSLSFGKVKGLLSTAFPVFFPSILLLLEVTVSKMKNVRQSQKKMLESKMFLSDYGVALVSRIDKIIGLFCKRAL
jgi:hypothetical protein